MKNLLKKLLLVSREIEPMEKDGTNTMQNYQYLSEKKVKLNVRELLNKHGVVFMHSSRIDDFTQIGVTSKGTPNWATKVHVDYKFYDAESGEMLEGWYEAHGTDTGDKGAFKATTGAVKNILMQNFLIPTGDDPEKGSRNSNQQSPTKSYIKPKYPASIKVQRTKAEQIALIESGNFTLEEGPPPQAGQIQLWKLVDKDHQFNYLNEEIMQFMRDMKTQQKTSKLIDKAEEIFNPKTEKGKEHMKTIMNL